MTHLYFRNGTNRVPIFDIGILRGEACITLGQPQRRGKVLNMGWIMVAETYTGNNASLSSQRNTEGGWYVCYRRQVTHLDKQRVGEETVKRRASEMPMHNQSWSPQTWQTHDRKVGCNDGLLATRTGPGWQDPADRHTVILRAQREAPTIPSEYGGLLFSLHPKEGVRFFGMKGFDSKGQLKSDRSWTTFECVPMTKMAQAERMNMSQAEAEQTGQRVIAQSGKHQTLSDCICSIRKGGVVPRNFLDQDLYELCKDNKYDNLKLVWGPDEDGNGYEFAHSRKRAFFNHDCEITVTILPGTAAAHHVL